MQKQMKEEIANAFVVLSEQKRVDKITVKDLVDYCGISRASFYYHFQDILELIEWLVQRTDSQISEHCSSADSFEESVQILVAGYARNYSMFERLQASQCREYINSFAIKSIQNFIWDSIRTSDEKRRLIVCSTDIQSLVVFCSYGIAGLMLQHFNSKKFDLDKLSQHIIVMVYRLITDDDASDLL